MEQDKEIKAINDILAALHGLEDGERVRVIKYVLERFGITNHDVNGTPLPSRPSFITKTNEPIPIQSSGGKMVTDIRILRDQKNPRSAIQMVVLVAYYLQEVAPIAERKETIDTSDIIKYFKQAGYRLPAGKKGPVDTLNNAKNAGYLEVAARGAFKLNPVGYNLIAYGLPENTSGHGKKRITKKQKKGKTTKGK